MSAFTENETIKDITMRQIYDFDFLLRHPDYKKLICSIDADGQFNWLDFNMKPKDRVELFNLGAKKAVDFLVEFDWEKYKIIRSEIGKVNLSQTLTQN